MNDDIKKFIDSTKLYTEVEVRKSEKLEEGFVDWVKGLAGLDDESVNAAVDNLLGDVTPEVEANIEKAAVAAETGTDAQAGTKANSDTTVTTQAQANSILQNPDATDAQRKAAQDFYDENSDPESTGPAEVDPNRPGGNNNPFKNTTDRYAWINAGRPDIWPPVVEPEVVEPEVTAEPEVNPAPEVTAEPEVNPAPEVTAEPEVNPAPQGELDATDTAQTGTDTAPAPQGELDATDTAQTGNRPVISPLARKLGQITSASLMRDYNAGGKRPMDSVKQVQTALSRLGFDPNGLDGKYGAGTFKAVQDFQKANGLTVDGQVGPNTIKALQTAITDAANKTT